MLTLLTSDRKAKAASPPTAPPAPDRADGTVRSPVPGLPAIEPGSIAAQALALLWNGEPAVVVKAPPGAGKTAQVVCIAALSRWAHLQVAVCCQTRTQVVDLANRLATEAPGLPVAVMEGGRGRRPARLNAKVEFLRAPKGKGLEDQVVVSTAAKWLHALRGWTPDVLIVDEAWQLPAASLGTLVGPSTQVCLVGDPGQIAPVVEGDTSRWATMATGPHRPAPTALTAANPTGVTVLTMDATRRCGPLTASVIAPLYDFDFRSARPERHISLAGSQLKEIESLVVPDVCSPGESRLLDAAAERACALAEQGTVEDADGSRSLGDAEVAVVCSHVAEVAGVAARLAAAHPGITVDTANRLQGLEFTATVVIDPLAGVACPIDHDLDLGRLSVMLSRHSAHCTWITAAGVSATLDSLPRNQVTRAQRRVRNRLARACGSGKFPVLEP